MKKLLILLAFLPCISWGQNYLMQDIHPVYFMHNRNNRFIKSGVYTESYNPENLYPLTEKKLNEIIERVGSQYGKLIISGYDTIWIDTSIVLKSNTDIEFINTVIALEDSVLITDMIYAIDVNALNIVVNLYGNQTHQTDLKNGITIKGSSNINIYNSNFSSLGKFSLAFDNAVYGSNDYINIKNSRFDKVGMYAVWCRDCNNLNIENDSILNWGYGVGVISNLGIALQEGGTNIVIQNNYFDSDSADYFAIEAYTPQEPIENLSIINNVFNSNYSGVSLFCNNSNLSYNDFNGTSGLWRDGFEFFGSHTVIRGNNLANGIIQISSGTHNGYTIYSHSDSIVNNTVYNDYFSAIEVGGTIDSILVDSIYIINNDITIGNTVRNCHGIIVGLVSKDANMQHCYIRENTIIGNAYPPFYNSGITCENHNGSTEVYIENNVVDSTYYGVWATVYDYTNILYINNNTLSHHSSVNNSIMTDQGKGIYSETGNTIIYP